MKWVREIVPTAPVGVGERVGDYEIRRLLGAGGMGAVYEAVQQNGTSVALKILLPERVSDEHAVRRFRDEAIAGLIVQHENLTATIGHGETATGLPFLVMERVCGEPLGALLHREGTMSLRRAVAIVQQILAALDALHSAGIVHGDVKTDNVLVEDDGGDDHVRVLDFGLAHVQFDRGDVRKPGPDDELVSGTPEYMAPEVVRGEGSTIGSDLYAAGVILYELLTGATPFTGTPNEIVRCHLEDQVVPPSLRRPEVPAILERVVLRALEKQPGARFASARTFASALAVVAPLLEEIPAEAVAVSPGRPRRSREAPTLQWIPGDGRRPRPARGTPRYRKSRR